MCVHVDWKNDITICTILMLKRTRIDVLVSVILCDIQGLYRLVFLGQAAG